MNENTAKAIASVALCACVAIATCVTDAFICLVALVGLGTIWEI